MEDDGALFKNVFSSLIEGILLVSSEGNILLGNPAIEEMVCQSEDHFKNGSVDQFLLDQPRVLSKVFDCIQSGTSYRDVECCITGKSDFDFFPARVTISPYLNSNGNPQGAILLIKDVRLIKDLEETSRQKDQLSTLESMALGLAHELKNPLGGIRGSAQLLRDELNDSEQREYLDIVVNEADRINRMLSQILNLAGSQKMHSEKTNIHKILEDIITLEKTKLATKNGAFIQDYDPSLPLVDADEDKLKQVFVNLIQNAMDASQNFQKIRLTTRIFSQFTVTPPEYPRRQILVEITDHGSGILKEDQNKLFTPFFTTKKRGTGLGLAISLKIIEDHQGKIKIVSRPGAGTKVQVFLPVHQKSE